MAPSRMGVRIDWPKQLSNWGLVMLETNGSFTWSLNRNNRYGVTYHYSSWAINPLENDGQKVYSHHKHLWHSENYKNVSIPDAVMDDYGSLIGVPEPSYPHDEDSDYLSELCWGKDRKKYGDQFYWFKHPRDRHI